MWRLGAGGVRGGQGGSLGGRQWQLADAQYVYMYNKYNNLLHNNLNEFFMCSSACIRLYATRVLCYASLASRSENRYIMYYYNPIVDVVLVACVPPALCRVVC